MLLKVLLCSFLMTSTIALAAGGGDGAGATGHALLVKSHKYTDGLQWAAGIVAAIVQNSGVGDNGNWHGYAASPERARCYDIGKLRSAVEDFELKRLSLFKKGWQINFDEEVLKTAYQNTADLTTYCGGFDYTGYVSPSGKGYSFRPTKITSDDAAIAKLNQIFGAFTGDMKIIEN